MGLLLAPLRWCNDFSLNVSMAVFSDPEFLKVIRRSGEACSERELRANCVGVVWRRKLSLSVPVLP
jgi:hypothetical protein